MIYQHPEVGAFYNEKFTTFRVWAPAKEQVALVLDGQLHSMEKDLRGVWAAEVQGVKPAARYKFRIGGNAFPDPSSLSQPYGVHGDSVVVDRNYPWTDFSWKGIPLGHMIIYEIHVGTFSSERTFEGIIKKLSYLRDLGINAIEIMPVAQFPGDRNWGYDGVFPFAVQDSYGGPTQLKQLVDEAHRYGIAVILDVVYNHQGPEGNYFSEFGPYFSERYKTNWGAAINFDGPYCDGVRNFYWQNALMWLNEFHIDGLRMDAVHAIWDFSAPHFVEELTAKVHTLEMQTGRKKVLVAEFDLNNPRYILPKTKGGYGMDGQWMDEFHHALHSVVTGEKNGYYEDFGEVTHLAKAFRDSYVYTGQYSVHRKRNFGVLPIDAPYSQFVVFAQNHDQVGNRFLGERLSSLASFEQLKLAAATYLLSPHVPMLFMGEEYGEQNPFQYFISHTDPGLVELVREGRKKEFAYFKTEHDVPDPFAQETFDTCMLSWDTAKDERRLLLEWYKMLIRFRKERKAMQNKERKSLIVLPVDSQKAIAFEKSYGSDRILVLLNFDSQAATITSPLNRSARCILDSSDKQWGGQRPSSTECIPANGEILVDGFSAMIFEI